MSWTNSIGCVSQLRFSRKPCGRGYENVVPIEMLHEVATDNMLKKFTTDTCQRYRAIVSRACLVSFLIDGCNIGLLPDVWETLLVEGGFEK